MEGWMDHRLSFVMLRQPKRDDPEESRSDPFYEMGCFGITGCHQTNLLSDTSAEGVRLAFVQGGLSEVRLVYVTPPVHIEVKGIRLVATWKPPEMPLRYGDAPILVENRVSRRNEALAEFLRGTNRDTPVGQFSSRFRSRKKPLPAELTKEVLALWDAAALRGTRSATYVEALPYLPNRPLYGPARMLRFEELMAQAGARIPSRCPPRATRPRTAGRC
jgi:hypothetical protein